MRHLRIALEAVLRGQKGVLPATYRLAVTPLAWIYGGVIKCRNLFYDRFPGEKVSIPVISIGNVVCGGTGKTDVVAAIAQKLSGKVAILSRGYGVQIAKPFVVKKEHGAEVCGDEPRLLADRLPHCLVIVGADRIAAAKLAELEGADIILLDDGMQHRRLHRDLEIAVWGEARYFLPKGLLRDDPKRMERADLRVSLEKRSGCSLWKSEIQGIFSLKGERIESIQNEKVALFCGIGNPERFVKTVEELGACITAKKILSDHQKAEENELALLLHQSGAKYLICTEKDQVKIQSELPILWVKRRLIVDEKDPSWQKAMAKVRMIA